MGDAMDRLDLDGDLAGLLAQVRCVRGQKTSKFNLLAKSIKIFKVDVTNSVVWKEVSSLKKQDGVGPVHNRPSTG